MPLFGLFNSKRDKKSANGIATSTDGQSNTSAVSEQDSESLWEAVSQITHEQNHAPSQSAPRSSSRLKLPFRRKTSDSPVVLLPQTSPSQPQRAPKPFMSSSSADVTERLRPPMMSAIFASHGETHVSSTRSLPTTTRTAPDTSSYQDVVDDARGNPPQTKKSGGLLSWARVRTLSKPSTPPVLPAEPFNLKAFRHVRPEFPFPQSDRPPSDFSLEPPPARPRPRGDSAASDSSQRISVAAFREAQARRSTANSPVPSFRPPSSTDTLTTRALTPTRSTPQDRTRPQAITRRSIVPDSSSSSSSSEEEESDDDTVPNRNRTITKRTNTTAKTEVGRSQEIDVRQSAPLQRPAMVNQPRSATLQMVSGGSHPSSSMSAYGKSRESVSTCALEPNTLDFPAKAVPPKKRHSSDSDTSSSSSGSDSDDAPLATLVGPRRPGSAMSGASNPRSRAPTKPLIDIKTLVTDRAVFSSSPESESASNKQRAMNKAQEVEREDVTGLAKLAALARQAEEAEDRSESAPSPPPSAKIAQPQPKAALSKPAIPNFSRPNHRRTSSDVVTSFSTADDDAEDEPPRSVSRGPEASVAPVRTFAFPSSQPTVAPRLVSPEPNEVDDGDIMPALRFMMPTTYPDDPARAPVVESSLFPPDETRIVPTPIKQRLPQSSFSVTSRPQHRTQQSSNSALAAASSTSTSTLTSPAITPKNVSSTASTSAASLESKPTSRPGRLRSSALTISTDRRPSLSNSSSPSTSPTLPPSVLKRPTPMSTNKSTPSSPVKSTASTASQSETSSGLTRRPRPRSSTLISQIPTSAPLNPDSRPQALLSSSRTSSRPDTLVSRIPPSSSLVSTTKPKPFAGSAMRRESPASSTGDSSSGRLPLTPADGSDFGSKDNWDKIGRLQQGRDRKEHAKRRSVTFGEDMDFERGRDKNIARERERERVEKIETTVEGENRRRERRRSEAKAAIELGNVINGRGPIDDSEDEDNSDLVRHNLGPQFNPMAMGPSPMNFSHSAGPPGWNHWQQQGQPSPGLVPPLPGQFGPDTNYLAAHQQAMMIAKQTYQMAVAQQALAAAGDEWERNSNISGFGGSQGFGPNPAFGHAGFGGQNMNVNMGMFGMGGGMGMGMPNGWSTASLMAPAGARSAYGGGFGGTQSEYGVSPGGGGGWGSRSVYGEAFGPSPGDRASKAFSAAPQGQPQHRQQQQQSPLPSSKGNRERERRNESSGHSNRADGGSNSSGQQHIRPGPRPRTLTAPSSSQSPSKMRRLPPPSSPPPSSFRRFNGA